MLFDATSEYAPFDAVAREAHGLPEGERALISMVICREAGRLDLALHHADRAAHALRDSFAVSLLLEEGLPSPLIGRLGAIATAAGALAGPEGAIGRFELRRLDANGVDAEQLVDLVATVAETCNDLDASAPKRADA